MTTLAGKALHLPGPLAHMKLTLIRKWLTVVLRACYLAEVEAAGELDLAPQAVTEPDASRILTWRLRRDHAESLLDRVRCPLVRVVFRSAIRTTAPERMTARCVYRLLGDAARVSGHARRLMHEHHLTMADVELLSRPDFTGQTPVTKLLPFARVVTLGYRA